MTTTKAAHTPGPWAAIAWTSRARTTVVTAEWAAAIAAGKHFSGGAVIADCQGSRSGYLDAEAETNARLIAAAPELLAALKTAHREMVGMRAYLETCAHDVILDNLSSTIASLKVRAEEAEAAIRKAKE